MYFNLEYFNCSHKYTLVKTASFLLLLSLAACKLRLCEPAEILKPSTPLPALRTNGVYVSDIGSSTCAGDSCRDVFFLYENAICFYALSIFEKDNSKLGSIDFSKRVNKTGRFNIGTYGIDHSKFYMRFWGPDMYGCNKIVVYDGQLVNDSAFIIKHWSFDGRDHQVDWTFRLYPGIEKPDSTNNFIK